MKTPFDEAQAEVDRLHQEEARAELEMLGARKRLEAAIATVTEARNRTNEARARREALRGAR